MAKSMSDVETGSFIRMLAGLEQDAEEATACIVRATKAKEVLIAIQNAVVTVERRCRESPGHSPQLDARLLSAQEAATNLDAMIARIASIVTGAMEVVKNWDETNTTPIFGEGLSDIVHKFQKAGFHVKA